MSHDHSMFFIIICLCINAVVMGQDLKNLLFFQQKVYGLERWLTNCSKAKMKGVFKSCWVFGFPLK